MATHSHARSQGNTFGECTRDVTGFSNSYDGSPNPHGADFSSWHAKPECGASTSEPEKCRAFTPTAPRGSSGAPVLTVTEVKPSLDLPQVAPAIAFAMSLRV